jgi:hypothetical protein
MKRRTLLMFSLITTFLFIMLPQIPAINYTKVKEQFFNEITEDILKENLPITTKIDKDDTNQDTVKQMSVLFEKINNNVVLNGKTEIMDISIISILLSLLRILLKISTNLLISIISIVLNLLTTVISIVSGLINTIFNIAINLLVGTIKKILNLSSLVKKLLDIFANIATGIFSIFLNIVVGLLSILKDIIISIITPNNSTV